MYNNLAQELTLMLSKLDNQVITMRNISSPDWSEIIEPISEDDVLVTNDNYQDECCDYHAICIDKDGKPSVVFSIDEQGLVKYRGQELEAPELIDQLKTIISRIQTVYTVHANVENLMAQQ